MSIVYSDDGGYVQVAVDKDGIFFSDEGYAIFSDGENDYLVPVGDIRCVLN